MTYRKLLSCAVLIFWTCFLNAQQAYFQQQVDYKIAVQLNDEAHLLEGNIEISYRNNAPQALDTLYFHLWPNAYRNNETAYAQQLRRRGESDFIFSDITQRGYIDSLAFSVDGSKVAWSQHPNHIDIAVLPLKTAIPPGATAVISTPFRVKLPYCFSRLGHVDQSYQITQWYPKPAVYDRNGWHPMPYLDMGEFYSEFGTYEVSITLPENYLVAATGVLQTPSEQQFLQEKSEEALLRALQGRQTSLPDLSFPASSKKRKTITYKASQVHDFAWFADKRFMVQKDTLQLSAGHTVDCWAFFTEEEQHLWHKATDYIKRSVRFYSELVGAYPYPQATAVQTALGAGGGMEYPMITNCGLVGKAQSLDELIAHEVGHNWFYGILASNERDHPWMDEGLNSYYDHRYSDQYYGGPDFFILPGFLFRGTDLGLYRLSYLFQARRRKDQAPDTHSDEMGEINYFLGAYEKPAQILKYLAQYLGQQEMDAAMQAYYAAWKFRHPQPKDFRESIEKTTKRELGWLFDGLIHSDAKQDYALQRARPTDTGLSVKVKNKGSVDGPFTLAGIRGQDTVFSIWTEGFSGVQQFELPKGEYSKIVLDAERLTLDLNRQNNEIRTDGLFRRCSAPRIRFFTAVEDDTRPNLYWLPVPSWNDYDKLMLGALLYNTSVPSQVFEWRALPSYAFGSNSITGLGDVRFNIYPEGSRLNRIVAGVSARSYHYRFFQGADENLRFVRWQPYLKFQFKEKIASNLHQEIMLRNIGIQEERLQFDSDGTYTGTGFQASNIQELSFTSEKFGGINSSLLKLAIEHQAYDGLGETPDRYVKASVEWERTFHFDENEALSIRFFGGAFLYHTERTAGYIAPGAFNLVSNGSNDYRYDDFYLGRTENNGFESQQISRRDGGFKTVIGQGFALGRSNNFILALNLKSDLPARVLPWLPVKPYFDAGYFDNAMPTGSEDTFNDQLLWNGGLMLSVLDETVAVYFPLVNSTNLQSLNAERGNYWKRISFQLDLHRLNPWRMVDRVNF
jgi:hypothetical protein